jgi:hypothetical protein
MIRALLLAVIFVAGPTFAFADDITDAMDQARKAYQSGDYGTAKQSLDLASQLIGQKNAEGFAALLPAPLSGWKAEEAQVSAVGQVAFGASSATRRYENAKGENVEVQITGDSAMIMQFATLLSNPGIAGAMGKLVKVADQRAIQTREGDVHIVVANKFLITVSGSADAASKMAYAQAVNYGKLTKM